MHVPQFQFSTVLMLEKMINASDRAFGEALREVFRSTLWGQFGVVDWSGTPPYLVECRLQAGLEWQSSTPWHLTPQNHTPVNKRKNMKSFE